MGTLQIAEYKRPVDETHRPSVLTLSFFMRSMRPGRMTF